MSKPSHVSASLHSLHCANRYGSGYQDRHTSGMGFDMFSGDVKEYRFQDASILTVASLKDIVRAVLDRFADFEPETAGQKISNQPFLHLPEYAAHNLLR